MDAILVPLYIVLKWNFGAFPNKGSSVVILSQTTFTAFRHTAGRVDDAQRAASFIEIDRHCCVDGDDDDENVTKCSVTG